jgi:hypothetical protein
MKKLTFLLAVAALAISALPASAAAPSTTAPTIQISVTVRVSDTGVIFSRYRARRGWGVHFNVNNVGKKPHRVDIGGLVTPVIKPGGKARVSANLEERGKYPYKVTLNPAGKSSGFFIVY